MNKTNVPKDPKLPLSKTSRKAFERRYQELFLREAEEGVSDEKLMKAVNDYESKQNPNPESKEQEGIQTETGNVSDGKGTEEGNKTLNVDISKQIMKYNQDLYKRLTGKDADESWDNDKVIEEIEYSDAVQRYTDFTKVKPPLGWSTDDINKELEFLETRKSASNKYFDLFGSQPIHSMTNDQILNAVDVKQQEIAKANEAKEQPQAPDVSLQAGQVLATHKVTGETKVFNHITLKYLNDWEETPIAPKELRK